MPNPERLRELRALVAELEQDRTTNAGRVVIGGKPDNPAICRLVTHGQPPTPVLSIRGLIRELFEAIDQRDAKIEDLHRRLLQLTSAQ